MKPAFVSVLLVLVAACELPTEPPPPKPPRVPNHTGAVVIVGRVVSTEGGVEVQGANVRVVEAGVSVGTDGTGHYRIVLPARYRGLAIPVNVRAIGFNPQTRTVSIMNDQGRVDFSIAVNSLGLTCQLLVR